MVGGIQHQFIHVSCFPTLTSFAKSLQSIFKFWDFLPFFNLNFNVFYLFLGLHFFFTVNFKIFIYWPKVVKCENILLRVVIWYNMSGRVWFLLIMQVELRPHCVYPMRNECATVSQTVRCDGWLRCSRKLEDPSWEGLVQDPKARDLTPFVGLLTSRLVLHAAARPVSHCINTVSIGLSFLLTI